MARTNVDLDDALVAEVMRRYGLGSKKDAVQLALERLVGTSVDRDFLLGLHGTGWGEDGLELDDVRGGVDGAEG